MKIINTFLAYWLFAMFAKRISTAHIIYLKTIFRIRFLLYNYHCEKGEVNMQVSLNWLKELVDLKDISVEQIAHELTMSGLEVE